MYLLAINCGSSSIKGKLYEIPDTKEEKLQSKANLSVSNIGSKDDKVKIKLDWVDVLKKSDNVDYEGENGDQVEYKSLVPLLLDKIGSAGVEKEQIKYITHRIVHGGTHKEGIRVTKEHDEGLKEMDTLSEFAPLHNHHAVLAVRSCLEALPNHESLLLFDTLFHQTIPPETYTYALPPAPSHPKMPLRKYGFHGLSYASIVRTMAERLKKSSDEVNIVVAHLGSGASACCIKGGKSIDTSMGLTPLEGLIGGTRTGTIDPSAIFHHTPNCAEDAGIEGVDVTKADAVMNKESGLKALAGTTNFGLILSRISDPTTCSPQEFESAKLAYQVYLDRLLGFLSHYVCKLLKDTPLDDIDGIVFSGGIGEKASELRWDALTAFKWLGVVVDPAKNLETKGKVREITRKGSTLRGWVVETDEEGWCAQLARDDFGF